MTFRLHVAITLVIAFLSIAAAEQPVHRAKLCASGSVCAYEGSVDFEFSQEGSGKEAEKRDIDVKFTIASICEHGDANTFKMIVVSVARAGATAEDTEKDNQNDELTRHPLYVTQSAADGSLSDVVSPELETADASEFKRGLLAMVSYPAAPEVLSGELTSDLEYEFESVDMHGKHTARHTAHKHASGITLLSTRTYAKAAEVPSLEAEAEAEEAEVKTTQMGTTKTELASGGETQSVDSKEEVTIPGPDSQEGEGDYTEVLEGTGEADIKINLDLKLVHKGAAEKECSPSAEADAPSFLQIVAGAGAQRIAAFAPPRARGAPKPEAFTAKDLAAATALLKADGDFTSETLRLSSLLNREGASDAVSKAGLRIYKETKDAAVFEKLAAALAASGRDGLARTAAMAGDDQHPAQLRVKALVALMAAKKAEEPLLRTVAEIAAGDYSQGDSAIPGDDDVPAAARLVLGALLNKHRAAPSDYVKELIASMESDLAHGALPPAARITLAASLGNAAFPSSSPYIATMASDSQPREVRLVALHALRRLDLAPHVESAVLAAARCNDTTVSGEAVRFLQETGNVVGLADLQVGGWTQELSVTFIEATQELSKSDIHYVKLTEGLYYKYGREDGKSTHKIEGSAKLTAGVYSVSWEFVKVGIYAEKKTGEKSGIHFFVDIMGYNVIKKTLAGGEPSVKALADVETDIDALLDISDEEKGATCSGAWAAGVAGDFGYTRELFKVEKGFWVYCVTIDVSFKGTGRVGLKPGLSVKSCENSRNGVYETMVMGGMEPYASVTINLEASINLWLVRGGVGGELKVIDIGFPLYGEKYWTTGDLCGYLDFRYEACSGRLYLFADYRSFYWRGWSIGSEWKRWGEINIITWTGWKGTKNILQQCLPGGGGNFAAVSLKNAGKDCWGGCGAKQGKCNWCGSGMCCRKGWHDKSNGCDGALGISGKGHVCVDDVKNVGKDCWGGCHARQGACAWCGAQGTCCRKGWHDKSNGCDGNLGISGKGHVCVKKP
jgi:hypothetical protein